MTYSQLRIAVLLNGGSTFTSGVKDSFRSAINAVSADAKIDFYDPVEAQLYPDPTQYDLIVLSGGAVDPMSATPWVLKMHDFLRTTVLQHPKQKIMGICWGHQTLNVAFGGIVGDIEKAELGITQIPLTATGSKFFSSLPSSGSYEIHEFHKREVKTAGQGFIPLAHGSQSFLSETNTIITFQGHPEMNAALAKTMLAKAPSYMCVEGAEKEEIGQKMEKEHDGLAIWTRVLDWVQEG